MNQCSRGFWVLLVALAAPAALAGPAEINGLARQLASLDAEIRATELRLREARHNLTGAAGDQGQHLRTLKRDREQVRQALKQATKAQQEREATATSMPTPRPGFDLGPAATVDAGQGPKVKVAPSGAMLPAPTL